MPSTTAFELYSPTDLEDALRFLHSSSGASVVASGTDLLPRVRKRLVAPTLLLDISSFREDLRYIRQTDGAIRIGALTTITDLLDSPLFEGKLSIVRDAAELFGAPQIRNVGTVGGNICSASSSEDLIPVLMVLDAKLKLISAGGERTVPLQDFVVGKRQTALKPSEILAEVTVVPPSGHSWTAFEKLGRRNMLIIALVSEALSLTMEDDLQTIRSARVALNRVAGKVPALASRTSGFLAGRKATEETIAEAQRVLASELALTGDYRASATYRTEVAQVYLKKLIHRSLRKIEEAN